MRPDPLVSLVQWAGNGTDPFTPQIFTSPRFP